MYRSNEMIFQGIKKHDLDDPFYFIYCSDFVCFQDYSIYFGRGETTQNYNQLCTSPSQQCQIKTKKLKASLNTTNTEFKNQNQTININKGSLRASYTQAFIIRIRISFQIQPELITKLVYSLYQINLTLVTTSAIM